MFVADDKAKKTLPKLQKLAVQVMDLLSAQTAQGMVFVPDARLRPDGNKGLLVNTMTAHEEYYRQRAQLWEIQALTRTRPIAGDAALGEEFRQLAARLTNFQQPSLPLAAFGPDWKTQIARMRQRIEKERTPPGQDALAFKTGAGGLMDAEFIAQAMCLEHGWCEANTLRVLERVRDEGILPSIDGERLLENYRQLRRLESILRRWSFEGEVMLPVEAAPYHRVAVRCGFTSSEAFRVALAGWRKAVREVYRKVFPH
jgi:glutamate-ammonia-ligase adenylyltransferase